MGRKRKSVGPRLKGLGLIAAFGLAVLVAAGSASAEAPGINAYVGCGQTRSAKPAHVCQIGETPGLFFESTTETTYDVCLTTPYSSPCALEQHAAAGVLYVNKPSVSDPGRYSSPGM